MGMAQGHRKGMGEWCSEGAPGPFPVNLPSLSLGGAQESCQGCIWTLILGGDLIL